MRNEQAKDWLMQMSRITSISMNIACVLFICYCLLLVTFVATVALIDKTFFGACVHKDVHIQKSEEESGKPPTNQHSDNSNDSRNDELLKNKNDSIVYLFPTSVQPFFSVFLDFGETVVSIFRESDKDPPVAGMVCLQQSVVSCLSDMFIQNFRINGVVFFRQF